MKELEKIYDPSSVEDKHYKKWVDAGYFHAERDPDKRPYTIVMPPPNITGQLHMGHAMDETWQDILIRYKRMQGYAALWVPGTDHASIATEAKIVAKMKEEGLTKQDLGRDRFLERAWDWKKQYGGRIVEQLKKLGCSCDWQRERFTMDEGCSKAVLKVFKKLYDDGLIYRGERIINWCPHCKTSISDAEVEYEEQDGFFWHLKYPVAGGDEFVELATTRPETMLGDTAIAVHPDDERYTHLHGKKVILPLVGKEIPVVCDTYVDREFGTGVVKITPAHDPNDFEVGVRHGLPVVKVLTDDAHMTQDCGKYAGMDRYEARKAIVADLEAGGYLASIEPHKHNVGTCYRCGTTVEPMVSKQWFVKMVPLAGPAIEAVRDGRIRFVPERFDKPYYNWMENTRDWCISRQLWWGHQIPVWYCDDCGKASASREDITECPHCHSTHIHRDPDVLDTWFSSALWPFSTMGWPDKTADLDQFFPTSVLVTGYDIIFFWVARMMFMTCEFMKDIPFENVFIHGLVRDSQGRKMSKSLGNGIDPLGVCEEYGADALRFTLVTGNTPGNDMRFYMERVEANRNFANKIWNASKFVIMNLTDFDEAFVPEESDLTLADRWILTSFNETAARVTEDLDKFELGDAADAVYNFIWSSYCDWYIELAKKRLYQAASDRDKHTVQYVLVYVLTHTLEMLHPFMPFVTEHLWQHLPHEGESIIVAPWPKAQDKWNFADDAATMNTLMEAIKGIRNLRAESNVPMGKKAPVILAPATEDLAKTLNDYEDYFHTLAFADKVTLLSAGDAKPENAVVAVVPGIEVYLQLKDLIDVEKETARVQKEQEKLQKEIDRLDKKLANQGFLAKAPAAVVEKEKGKLADYQEKMAALTKRMEDLAKL